MLGQTSAIGDLYLFDEMGDSRDEASSTQIRSRKKEC
jgi:hypothetical protein